MNKSIILADHFDQTLAICGTQFYHCFPPLNKYILNTLYKNNVTAADKQIIMVSSYVTHIYDIYWYIGIVQHKQDTESYIRFTKPHGPSYSFSWSQKNKQMMRKRQKHSTCYLHQAQRLNEVTRNH